MTRHEFGIAIAVLQAGCGKTLTEEALEVYYQLLGDLEYPVFQAAVEKVLLEHRYPTVPAIAVLRQEAVSIRNHAEGFPDPFEAWRIAMMMAASFGLARKQEAQQRADLTVWRAIECIGWQVLCDMPAGDNEYIGTQFRKAYESLARKRSQRFLLPPALAAKIEEIGRMPDEEGRKLLANDT
jgi:hypothetical protein